MQINILHPRKHTPVRRSVCRPPLV